MPKAQYNEYGNAYGLYLTHTDRLNADLLAFSNPDQTETATGDAAGCGVVTSRNAAYSRDGIAW